MGEKRKPTLIMMLKKPGKGSYKIEIFKATLWPSATNWLSYRNLRNRYRLRVNGKWFKGKDGEQYLFFTRYEIRDLLWRSLSFE